MRFFANSTCDKLESHAKVMAEGKFFATSVAKVGPDSIAKEEFGNSSLKILEGKNRVSFSIPLALLKEFLVSSFQE